MIDGDTWQLLHGSSSSLDAWLRCDCLNVLTFCCIYWLLITSVCWLNLVAKIRKLEFLTKVASLDFINGFDCILKMWIMLIRKLTLLFYFHLAVVDDVNSILLFLYRWRWCLYSAFIYVVRTSFEEIFFENMLPLLSPVFWL